MVAYFGLLLLLDFPTLSSMWAYSQISLGLAGARRILELINRETDLDQNAAGYTGPMRGEIEFRDVTFAYQNGERAGPRPDISFRFKPGQTVAIVGQTGAGKTSLVRLVNRTYDATSRAGAGGRRGCARVEPGSPAPRHLDHRAGYLPVLAQHRREYRLWQTRRQPRRRSQRLPGCPGAMNSSQTFKEGYETVIGERGVTLSGGQRQRLALARAFLTDPRILILDDSTSAIDSATEDKIQRAISAAARGRTTLIITHRLSQIRWADLIIVLRQGRMAARARHDELMHTSEAYRTHFHRPLKDHLWASFLIWTPKQYDRQYSDRQLVRRIAELFPALKRGAC